MKCKLCGNNIAEDRKCQCFCSDKCENDSMNDGINGPMCTCNEQGNYYQKV